MPTKKPGKQPEVKKRKRVYKPHPIRQLVSEFNGAALFVGFAEDYTYDGAILGTAERHSNQEVVVVSSNMPKAERDKIVALGAIRTQAGVKEIKSRRDSTTVIVYSCRLIVEILAQKLIDDGDATDEDAHEQAQEWHDFNTFSAWHGENTPIFVEDYPRD